LIVHCLIIGKVWPEPASTAAGRRTVDLIRALQSVGWRVSFASAAKATEYSLDLESLGIETHTVQPNDDAFDGWITELAPAVVIFDRFMIEEQFGWRVEKACPLALRVLDTSDLHCLREARAAQLKNGQPINLYNEVALREIAAIHRSDLTLMISEYEVEVLRASFSIPEQQLAYWPFGLTLADRVRCKSFDERRHFIMIGSFMHLPNVDAVRWCKNTSWPFIRKALPAAELHCYGSYGDKYLTELNAPGEGFYCKGRAGNALETMESYRVNLAPLRYGAGLKGKVFDGFQTGTPTVTTPIGAEGIGGTMDWGCAISEDPQLFAETAIQVYTDPALWTQVQSKGRLIAQERFAAAVWSPQLPVLIATALEQRDANRQQQFTGRMLRHHHHRSTEFMSRWIEAKNR
jgi:glycosyltransferase involved in cell wall biosynthesis